VIVLVSILLFGGAVIFDFAFAILIGIVVGTYSSVFIASPIVLAWERLSPSKRKRK
jgi:preprotein translocase subunit SecF